MQSAAHDARSAIAGIAERHALAELEIRRYGADARDLDVDLDAPRPIVVTQLLACCFGGDADRWRRLADPRPHRADRRGRRDRRAAAHRGLHRVRVWRDRSGRAHGRRARRVRRRTHRHARGDRDRGCAAADPDRPRSARMARARSRRTRRARGARAARRRRRGVAARARGRGRAGAGGGGYRSSTSASTPRAPRAVPRFMPTSTSKRSRLAGCGACSERSSRTFTRSPRRTTGARPRSSRCRPGGAPRTWSSSDRARMSYVSRLVAMSGRMTARPVPLSHAISEPRAESSRRSLAASPSVSSPRPRPQRPRLHRSFAASSGRPRWRDLRSRSSTHPPRHPRWNRRARGPPPAPDCERGAHGGRHRAARSNRAGGRTETIAPRRGSRSARIAKIRSRRSARPRRFGTCSGPSGAGRARRSCVSRCPPRHPRLARGAGCRLRTAGRAAWTRGRGPARAGARRSRARLNRQRRDHGRGCPLEAARGRTRAAARACTVAHASGAPLRARSLNARYSDQAGAKFASAVDRARPRVVLPPRCRRRCRVRSLRPHRPRRMRRSPTGSRRPSRRRSAPRCEVAGERQLPAQGCARRVRRGPGRGDPEHRRVPVQPGDAHAHDRESRRGRRAPRCARSTRPATFPSSRSASVAHFTTQEDTARRVRCRSRLASGRNSPRSRSWCAVGPITAWSTRRSTRSRTLDQRHRLRRDAIDSRAKHIRGCCSCGARPASSR